jgi:hypothetical protein
MFCVLLIQMRHCCIHWKSSHAHRKEVKFSHDSSSQEFLGWWHIFYEGLFHIIILGKYPSTTKTTLPAIAQLVHGP